MSDSVTHKEQKQREIAAKHMHNLQEGKLPGNEEIVRGIDTLQKKLDQTKPNLSETGQKAGEHLVNILETAKEMVETKNESEHLQKSFYHMYQAGRDQPMSANFAKLREIILPSGEDIKGIQSQARQHVDNLLTIVKLCIMSSEFRQTLNEFFQFFSSLLHKRSKQFQEKFHQSHGLAAPSSPQQGGGHGSVDSSSIRANESAIRSSLLQQFNSNDLAHAGNVSDPMDVFPSQHQSQPQQSQQSSDKWKLSREQEDKLIDRMVDLLQSIHKYSEFSNAVEFFSDSLESLSSNWRENIHKISDEVHMPDAPSSKMHREASKRELIEFIENWVGEDYSLDPLIDSVIHVRDVVQHDPELRQLFKDLRVFFTKSAKDSNYVNDKEKVRHDARDLIDRTRNQLLYKHREDFRRLKHELLFLNNAIQKDDSLLKLRGDVKDLVRTLTTDQNGNPTVKPELLSDVQFLVQALFDTIKYLPLPPIEREDEDGTFRLENVVVNCTDILPSQIKVSTTLDATGQNNNAIEIRLSHIRAHLRNAKFFYDKRSGFPHIKESGLVDVDLAGKRGMDIFLSVRPNIPHKGAQIDSLFTVNECSCTISKLRLRLRETKHDALYKFLSPVINSIARKRIETLVQDQIEKAINQFDRKSVTAWNKGHEKAPAAKAKHAAEKVKEKAAEKTGKPSEKSGHSSSKVSSH